MKNLKITLLLTSLLVLMSFQRAIGQPYGYMGKRLFMYGTASLVPLTFLDTYPEGAPYRDPVGGRSYLGGKFGVGSGYVTKRGRVLNAQFSYYRTGGREYLSTEDWSTGQMVKVTTYVARWRCLDWEFGYQFPSRWEKGLPPLLGLFYDIGAGVTYNDKSYLNILNNKTKQGEADIRFIPRIYGAVGYRRILADFILLDYGMKVGVPLGKPEMVEYNDGSRKLRNLFPEMDDYNIAYHYHLLSFYFKLGILIF